MKSWVEINSSERSDSDYLVTHGRKETGRGRKRFGPQDSCASSAGCGCSPLEKASEQLPNYTPRVKSQN